MPDESQDIQAPVAVADGQSVVNAVATDTQSIVDGAVDQIGVMLQQQSETQDGATTCEIGEAQFTAILDQMRLNNTATMFTSFVTMCVFGAVCAGYFVKGWRRG